MTLDNLYDMAAADQYTDEGRQQIQDARRTYKIGEKSEKTGMIKTANGWRKPTNQGAAAGSKEKTKSAAYMDEQGLHDIYMDIKNNELEDYTVEEIAKEYKITKGDAEVIKNRIENNKRAKEQDKQDRSNATLASTFETAKNGGEAPARKAVDNITGSNYKKGQRVPNAGAIGQTYRHRERQYLAAHQKEADANPKEVTERRDVLASLVANSREQAQMYEAIKDRSEGEGNEWEINGYTAEKLNRLLKEEKQLQGKLKKLDNAPAAGSTDKWEVTKNKNYEMKTFNNENEMASYLEQNGYKPEGKVTTSYSSKGPIKEEVYKNGDKTVVKLSGEGVTSPRLRRKTTAGSTEAPEKTYTFTKAGHVYNVPASSPAEAVQKLKSRGVKGFKESDAFDDSTPRTPQPAPDYSNAKTPEMIQKLRDIDEAGTKKVDQALNYLKRDAAASLTGDTKIKVKASK